jgi:hypothetical protein
MTAPFSASIRTVNPPNPPSDPKVPPPDLNLPVFMGRITLPEQPRPQGKRRWGWLLLWSVLMFAGGVAAGPALTDHACLAVGRAASLLGMPAPRFVANRRPAAPSVVSEPAPSPEPAPAIEPAPAPAPSAPRATASEKPTEAPIAAAKPVEVPAEAEPEPEKPAAVPAPREPLGAKHAAIPARAEVEPAEPAPLRHGKGGVKTTVASAGTPGKRAAGFEDPFASDSESAGEAKVAAPSGKAKSSPSEPAAAAKSEPAAKPAAAKSHDSLDNLMADGVGDSKGKKSQSKDLDALLKDVQKSKPEPAPKREEPPAASALSPSDISKVMAGVKTRANSCAQRLGQQGIAELKITVSKGGAVTDVQVGGKIANTPLAACIEKATRAAIFPASSGLKFDYRIDAR